MRGYILLEGGSEFGGQMAAPDRRAIELAGGPNARICIIPTAAAPDHNDRRAGENGVRWFKQLGATQVVSLPLIDRASANDPAIVDALRAARLIYLLGGFTDYLGKTLSGSASEQALAQAHQAGAVIAGSSAGAMVLCEHYYAPDAQAIQPGLNRVPNACVIPHHNTFGKGWASRLAALLPGDILIGIDEQTGMIDDGAKGEWSVYGKGVITLYKQGKPQAYRLGQSFALESPLP
ncbi:MAG: Type 1 glutamine amidotransferase-like domain-containing protein [Anaerolineae bacterium]